MSHETIRDEDFQRNTALQYCCNIVLNGCNIVPTLQCCVALKIVVANHLVSHHLKSDQHQISPCNINAL